MNLKQYLSLMSLGTILCWIIFVLVLFNFDPFFSGNIALAFFYISLFLATTGTVSVFGFLLKKLIIKNDEIIFRHIKKTFRQGIIFSCFLVTFLFLSHEKLMNWLNGFLLVSLYLFIEGIIFTNRKHKNNDYVR